MRPRSAWAFAFTLAAVFVARAQPFAYVDSGSVPEPWSGWWWPTYDAGPDSGPYLWQGEGGQYGADPGPIYDLDTRYFWWQEPRRTRAQRLEYEAHRTTDPNHKSWGHCHGVSFAQALEPQPPADNGALSQDDLEGLLSEIHRDGWIRPAATHPRLPLDSASPKRTIQPGVTVFGTSPMCAPGMCRCVRSAQIGGTL